MEQILTCAREELRRGRPTVLAVITASQGSTPRSGGAAMLVGQDGILAGTIGGGALEHECCQMAMDPPERLMTFSLDNPQAAGLGMVCGGSVQVLFVPLEDESLIEQGLRRVKDLEPGWLMLPMEGGEVKLAIQDLPAYPQLVSWNGEACFSLPLSEPGRIFIIGGGHVAFELAHMLDVLGYPYVVLDDREEFANRRRYPGAQRVLTAPFTGLDQVLEGNLMPGPLDCICIMTRGHLHDMDALRFALHTPAGYIGLMGSRRKRERIFAQLTQEGFLDGPQRIITPIGLALGGQTPAEVAVSIAAQLVQHRSQKRHDNLSAL